MTEHNAEEAADLAKEQAAQAGHQAKAAAKNSGRAARAAAEPVAELVREGVTNTVDQLEDTADSVVRSTKRIDLNVLGHMSSDAGVGFLALSVAIYSGTVAYTKFRQVFKGRNQVLGS